MSLCSLKLYTTEEEKKGIKRRVKVVIFIRFNCEHFYTSIPRKYVIPRRHSEVLPTTEYGIYRICFLDAYLLPVRDTKRAITFWNTRSTVPISSSNGANSSPALRLQFGACVHPKTERTGTNSCPTRQRRVRQASRTSSERADRETNVESWNVKGRHSIHSSFGDASGTDERSVNVCFRQEFHRPNEMTSNNEAGHANSPNLLKSHLGHCGKRASIWQDIFVLLKESFFSWCYYTETKKNCRYEPFFLSFDVKQAMLNFSVSSFFKRFFFKMFLKRWSKCIY